MKATIGIIILLPMLFFTDTNVGLNNEAAVRYKETEVDRGMERFGRMFVKGNKMERDIDSLETLILELELEIEKTKHKDYEK